MVRAFRIRTLAPMWGHHSVSTFLTRSPVSCSRKVSPIAGLLRILSRVTELLIARVMDKLQEHRLEIVPPWLQFVFIMILKYTCTHIQYVYMRAGGSRMRVWRRSWSSLRADCDTRTPRCWLSCWAWLFTCRTSTTGLTGTAPGAQLLVLDVLCLASNEVLRSCSLSIVRHLIASCRQCRHWHCCCC